MEVIFILAINLGICFLIAKAGEKRKIGFGWSFFFCLFLSPIVGGIITMLSPKVFDNNTTNQ
jgi:predicted phage tail protein